MKLNFSSSCIMARSKSRRYWYLDGKKNSLSCNVDCIEMESNELTWAGGHQLGSFAFWHSSSWIRCPLEGSPATLGDQTHYQWSWGRPLHLDPSLSACRQQRYLSLLGQHGKGGGGGIHIPSSGCQLSCPATWTLKLLFCSPILSALLTVLYIHYKFGKYLTWSSCVEQVPYQQWPYEVRLWTCGHTSQHPWARRQWSCPPLGPGHDTRCKLYTSRGT